MGAKIAQKRSLQARQLKSLDLCISFDGSIATPVATGPDARFVSSITDLGVGQYVVILTQTFEQNLFPAGICCEGDARAEVVSVAADRITFDVTDAAGAAADAVCYVNLRAYDHRFFY